MRTGNWDELHPVPPITKRLSDAQNTSTGRIFVDVMQKQNLCTEFPWESDPGMNMAVETKMGDTEGGCFFRARSRVRVRGLDRESKLTVTNETGNSSHQEDDSCMQAGLRYRRAAPEFENQQWNMRNQIHHGD